MSYDIGQHARVSLKPLARFETVTVVLLVASVIFGAATSPLFLSGQNLTFLMSNVVYIALMALPEALLIVAGEIDLSVGSILGLASVLMGFLWNHNLPMEAIIPLVVLAGALAGIVNGQLVTRFGLPSLAVTIGTLGVFGGLAYIVLGSAAVSDFPAQYLNFGNGNVGGTPIPQTMLVFVVLAIGFGVLLHSTVFGRRIFVIGANQQAAYFSGVRVKRIKTILFMLSGAVCGVAGIVFTLSYGSAQATNGTGAELSVLTAVLLGGVSIFGGRGSMLGVVCAVFLLGSITNSLTLDGVSTQVQTMATGLLLLLSAMGPGIGARVRDARKHYTGEPPQTGRSAAPAAEATITR